MPQYLERSETDSNHNHHTPLQQDIKREIETQEEIISLPINLYNGLCTPEEASRIREHEQSWQKKEQQQ